MARPKNPGKNAARRDAWEEIRLRYSYGETLSSLANEYQIPVNTVQARAGRHKWSQDRKAVAAGLQQKREEHIQQQFVQRQNEVLGKQFETAQAVYLQYQRLLAEAGESNNAKLIVACQKTLAWATNSLRQVTGLPDRVIETHTYNQTDNVRIEKTISALKERFSAHTEPPVIEATIVD